jgi:hypothetical protein
MNEEALQACVDRHLEHAAMVFMLDDELGTHHGLSWADFVLLTVLDAAGGAAPATELARTLRTPASLLLLRLLREASPTRDMRTYMSTTIQRMSALAECSPPPPHSVHASLANRTPLNCHCASGEKKLR